MSRIIFCVFLIPILFFYILFGFSSQEKIQSSSKTTEFLLKKAKQMPFRQLEAEVKSTGIKIIGKPAFIVRFIHLDMKTNFLRAEIYEHLLFFLHKVDSRELIEKLFSNIHILLLKRGYLRSSIKIIKRRSKDSLEIDYQLIIDKGPICHIDQVNLNSSSIIFPELKKLFYSLKYCDEKNVYNTIYKAERMLRNKGFYGSRISSPKFRYKENNFHADLSIDIEIKTKKILKILEKDKKTTENNYILNKLLSLDFIHLDKSVMKSEILFWYHDIGYFDAKILDVKYLQLKTHDEYIYSVDEGSLYRFLGQVKFIGNEEISTDVLQEQYGYSFFKKMLMRLTFKQVKISELKVSVQKIVRYYKEQGFWAMKIAKLEIAKVASLEANHSMFFDLIVMIQEGARYFLEDLSIVGQKFLSESDFDFSDYFKIGQPINFYKFDALKKKLRSLYLASGFLYSKISIDKTFQPSHTDKKKRFVKIILSVQEGKRTRIGKIHIVGAVKTPKTLIHKALKFREGDFYVSDVVERSKTSLQKLGLFNWVQISIFNKNQIYQESDSIDLLVQLKEKQTVQVTFGPSYALQHGLRYKAEISYTNLFHSGQKHSVVLGISEEKHQYVPDQTPENMLLGWEYSFGLTEPFIFSSPLHSHLFFKDEASGGQIWKFSKTFELSFDHEFNHSYPHKMSFFFQQKFMQEVGSEAQEQNLISTDRYQLGLFGLYYELDQHNDRYWPTGGGLLKTRISVAKFWLNSGIEYYKWEGSYDFYLQWLQFLIFRGYFDIATYTHIQTQPYYSQVLPESSRLTFVGLSGLKGFSETAVNRPGPYVRYYDQEEETYNREVIGGTTRHIFLAEILYRWPKTNLGFGIFFNMGTLFFNSQQQSAFEAYYRSGELENISSLEDNFSFSIEDVFKDPLGTLDHYYRAYGVSTRYITAVGSLNLSLAWPWYQPTGRKCRENKDLCFDRSIHRDGWQKTWLGSVEIGLTIESRF